MSLMFSLRWPAARRLVARQMALHRSIIDLIGNTPLVELCSMSPRDDVHLYAKLEG